jgi:hypothetical protein
VSFVTGNISALFQVWSGEAQQLDPSASAQDNARWKVVIDRAKTK